MFLYIFTGNSIDQMDRRTTIKGLIAFVSIGVPSFSFYKWTVFNSAADVSDLQNKKLLLADLAEVIIPRTDTPGAKDAGVENFIILMISDCTEPRTQHNFLNGLDDVEAYAIKNYSRQFTACTAAQKNAVLTYFEEKAIYKKNILNKIRNKLLGVPFFVKLKQLTVEGYCTSKIGATMGLAYDYIPSTYQSCISLTPQQKSWATK